MKTVSDFRLSKIKQMSIIDRTSVISLLLVANIEQFRYRFKFESLIG